MVTVSTYLANNGNGFASPSAVVNGYLYYGDGSAGAGTILAYNIAAASSTTLETGGAAPVIGSPFTGNAIIQKGYQLAYVSGATVTVGYYAVAPSIFSNYFQNGLVMASGVGFNTSLTNVVIWTAASTDNSTVGVFYIEESQINGSTSATVAASFVPIAPTAPSAANNNTFATVVFMNGVYYMIAVGGGAAPRGAVVVLSSTDLTSWTSILSLSGSTISTPSGFMQFQAAATPQGIVFPWVNPATGVISIVLLPSATPSTPTYINTFVSVTTTQLTNQLNTFIQFFGSLVILGIDATNGNLASGGSSIVMVYDFTTSNLFEVWPTVTSVSATVTPNGNGNLENMCLLSNNLILFGLAYIGATTSSSIMVISFDNFIGLTISAPALTQGQTVTAQVSTSPATSNITINLYAIQGELIGFTGFGGTLLGSGVTNTSGVADISFTVPSYSTVVLLAEYAGG